MKKHIIYNKKGMPTALYELNEKNLKKVERYGWTIGEEYVRPTKEEINEAITREAEWRYNEERGWNKSEY